MLHIINNLNNFIKYMRHKFIILATHILENPTLNGQNQTITEELPHYVVLFLRHKN